MMNRNSLKILIIILFHLFLVFPINAEITGSVHDFSSNGWSSGEICIVCHTPHNADTTVQGSALWSATLWNHEVTTAIFTLYSSPTLDVLNTHQPRGASKLCLSCHDGTVAIDSFGGNVGGADFVSGPALIGIDLSNDHPVSIRWNHQTVSPPCMNCHQASNPIIFYEKASGGGSIECGTCHDVHNGPQASTNGKLLRLPLTSSTLCLHCHGK